MPVRPREVPYSPCLTQVGLATQGGPELPWIHLLENKGIRSASTLHKGVTMSVKKEAIYSNAANSVPAQLTRL